MRGALKFVKEKSCVYKFNAGVGCMGIQRVILPFPALLFILLSVFCRWMYLMQLNVTAKKDDSLSSWPVRIMGQDRHVTGRQRGLGCRCVK